MRRLRLLSSFLISFIVGAAVLAGQSPPAGQTNPPASSAPANDTAQPAKDTKLVTMVGCIGGADATAKAANTFVDAKQGVVYRLTGRNVREYAGSRVQITGTTDSRRIHIQGGLLPNPNVAAQAGAIDPGQA